MTRFSIITCTWNSQPYVRQAVESVLQQSFSDYELVFVDGGSTDGTLEYLETVAGRVTILRNIRGGISNAMNAGAKAASGQFIAHLHGDDYYLDTDMLAEVDRMLSKSGKTWLFGRIQSDIDGTLVAPTWQMPDYSQARLLSGNFIAHPATFVSRSLFLDAGGFDTELRYAMDYDLWLKLAVVSEPVYLPRYIAAFRRHAGSTSTANALAALEEDYRVRLKHAPRQLLPRIGHCARFLVRRHRLKRRMANAEESTR
jgi:glycosyltransferase involved in cell wall biosynthesis